MVREHHDRIYEDVNDHLDGEDDFDDDKNAGYADVDVDDIAGEMQEEMCLFIRTRADFLINFRTRPGTTQSS